MNTIINLCQTPTTRPMTPSPSAEFIFTAISSEPNTPKKYNSKKRPRINALTPQKLARPVSKAGSTKKLVQSEVKVGLYNTLAFLYEAALSSQLDIFNHLIGGVEDAIS